MKNQDLFREVVLAALFHDIGKFAQRAKEKKYCMGDPQSLCPVHEKKGYYGYTHSRYTDGFLTQFNELLPNGIDKEKVISLAARHHKPKEPLEWIIAESDRLSAGLDRIERDFPDEEKFNFDEVPLISIFSKVKFTKESELDRLVFKLNKLKPENIFPEKKQSLNREDYKNLWKDFESDFYKFGKGLSFEQFLFAIDSLLEYYTWCIPSSIIDEPDISLYDHSITTAAIAAVLYRYHLENDSINDIELIKNRDIEKYILISGDLSGIQRYIFNLKTSSDNAKLLRARSFELQAACDAVVYEILGRLELPTFCRIMNAGGRFILLLPNIKRTKDEINNIRNELENYFLKHYYGELALNLSEGVVLNGENLKQEKMKEVFLKISQDVNIAKQKKFQAALKNNSYILEYNYEMIKGSANVCDLCEIRPIVHNNKCEFCNELVNFGAKIPKAKYLFLTKNSNIGGSKLSLPFDWKLYAEMEKRDDIPEGTFLFSINEFVPGTALYKIPYYLPTSEEGDVLTFEQLAKKSEGDEKIAMLKADLDNLGAIFSIGLGNKISISRFSTLSRMINYFFSVFVNHLIKESYRNIYTVFSGGDDLCVIGPWTDIIDFSEHIQEEFTRFTGSNRFLTISGGIALAHHKLPVRDIANNSERYLEDSKTSNKKNSLTIFQTTVKWDDFKVLRKFGEELYQNLKNEKISKGLVYRLMNYGEKEKEGLNGRNLGRNLLWRSHFSYDVARNVKEENLKDMLKEKVIKNISNIKIPVSYALYKYREKNKED